MIKRLLIALSLLAAPAVFAQGGLSIGAKVGTLGPGIEMAGYLLTNLNLRVSGQYLPLSVNGSSDEVDYNADIEFANLLAMLDWFPFDNNFRISAGLALNNNKLDMKGDLNDTTKIGDHRYTASQIGTLKGDATFDSYAPYLGIGFGNSITEEGDLTFSFDLGVMFQGSADVNLHANGSASGDPTFQSDLAKEERDAQDVADEFTIYPVISFGIAYYFW